TPLTFEGARVPAGALLGALWPRATVATPNRPEAEALAGMTIADDASRDAVAKRLLAGGAKNVVIKGGHDDGEESVDHWYDGKAYRRLTAPRRVGPSVRGTGCVFASALAAGLALGKSLADALVCAKEFVTRFVEDPLAAGPVGIGQLPIHAEA
ncbi:MAG: bifunctional hydroxymethylpyrimidine kinase/phosphomethylpyrimidine kinase, partial [Deltaproteobacteria bacterium]|nr:bifunctional hydroxymethylpyrimidine kinase/phosphomethylpyrimidine kinase [Deltaproteobacteria bacterium]